MNVQDANKLVTVTFRDYLLHYITFKEDNRNKIKYDFSRFIENKLLVTILLHNKNPFNVIFCNLLNIIGQLKIKRLSMSQLGLDRIIIFLYTRKYNYKIA